MKKIVEFGILSVSYLGANKKKEIKDKLKKIYLNRNY
jgi:hypothetical protein